MKRVEWRGVLRCICALACISCADTLGLHDLVEGEDSGGGPAESASLSDGGEALPNEAGAPTGTDLGDALPEASVSGPTSSDLTLVGVGDAAAPSETDTGPATPVTEPIPVVGGAPPEPDGGAPMPKPDGAAAGCNCGAAPCTVHSNGVGQTFGDCVPNGTHDETQALAACTAFTGTSASCTIQSCQGGGGGPGKSAAGQGVCSTGASVCDCWTFAGAEVGLVQSTKSKKCDPCANGGVAWN
jgi:hypothetical protein